MPLEIKELHIKATISDGSDQGGNISPNPVMDKQVIDQMVKVCVDKVLTILNDKADR